MHHLDNVIPFVSRAERYVPIRSIRDTTGIYLHADDLRGAVERIIEAYGKRYPSAVARRADRLVKRLAKMILAEAASRH